MASEDLEGMTPADTPQPVPEPEPTYAYDPKPSSGPAPEPVYEPAPEADGRAESVKDSARAFARKLAALLDGWFPGHGNTVLFGVLGLVLALLIFTIGVWRSFVIAFLVLVGIAFGQYLDGDPKILRLVRDLLDKED